MASLLFRSPPPSAARPRLVAATSRTLLLLFGPLRTSFLRESKWLPLFRSRDSRRPLSTAITTTCFCNADDKLKSTSSDDYQDSNVKWLVLRRWDVPWSWQTITLTMMACGLSLLFKTILKNDIEVENFPDSFVLTGLVEASLLPYLGFEGREVSLDEKAELLFAGQFSVTAVVLGVMYGITKSFEPLPDDLFCYDLRRPFELRDGWLLWAGIGFIGALLAIALTGVALNAFHGENPQREKTIAKVGRKKIYFLDLVAYCIIMCQTDALVRLLPLIGSSGISTACLVGITGVLAPVLEETIFRGFLMASLTKYLPTPVSVIISAATFALAHLTPGEFPQLFILGVALGFSYAQTHNLLTPITIHAFWNSGVILLLTFLQCDHHDMHRSLYNDLALFLLLFLRFFATSPPCPNEYSSSSSSVFSRPLLRARPLLLLLLRFFATSPLLRALPLLLLHFFSSISDRALTLLFLLLLRFVTNSTPPPPLLFFRDPSVLWWCVKSGVREGQAGDLVLD
ncbi:hypothetical protein ZIOFF_016703 [Zingiber officinale]|uniref:CAAX prenyl protease 2/Lysostaphin resistance protein A-like domain-containing protein n=1 Tax=Zingiber officinale TaxID=94328 RepID=A0A8J5I2X5_ZINOF|nr:hypothetical protein ZIOFF_016703 [Zingiber officinale]